nr:acyltransferase family protein [uncultured Draconibacterium sp.]
MSERRYDIDWIRVIVFDILIFWHVGLFFVAWENQVEWDLPLKNNVQLTWLFWPMMFIRQWRLSILFLISGIGTCFSLSSKSGGTYLKERFIRLFIPLLTAIFIVVPPQVYIERLAQSSVSISFFQYYPSTFQGVYPEGNFSWGHLWFVAYLLVMSVASLPLFLYLRSKGSLLFRLLSQLIRKSPFYLYVFCLPLLLIEISLQKRFPLTMALTNDWYAFSYYFICFLAGFIIANLEKTIWNAFVQIRHFALAFGIVASIPVLIMIAKGESPLWLQLLKPLNVWSWILAIFGFSSKYLNRKSALLSYRNAAVYPFYILHFTITLLLGYLIKDAAIHYLLKILLMIIGTYGISFIFYEFVIRRVPLLQPLFGVKMKSSAPLRVLSQE